MRNENLRSPEGCRTFPAVRAHVKKDVANVSRGIHIAIPQLAPLCAADLERVDALRGDELLMANRAELK